MNDQSTSSEEDRVKAAELYAKARESEAQRDYKAAMESYKQSLRLYDDPLVKAAFFRLMATIGPL